MSALSKAVKTSFQSQLSVGAALRAQKSKKKMEIMQ